MRCCLANVVLTRRHEWLVGQQHLSFKVEKCFVLNAVTLGECCQTTCNDWVASQYWTLSAKQCAPVYP